MKEAGIPPSDARHMLEVASLTEDEFKSVVPSTMKAMEKVERRIVRQILRARGL
jgi:hypothetical protein